MDGHTIISPCWLIGTDNSICIIFPIHQTSIFLPHRLSWWLQKMDTTGQIRWLFSLSTGFPMAIPSPDVQTRRKIWMHHASACRLLCIKKRQIDSYGKLWRSSGQERWPNDGNGIGRVVREIKKDGSFGPHFISFTITMRLMKRIHPILILNAAKTRNL